MKFTLSDAMVGLSSSNLVFDEYQQLARLTAVYPEEHAEIYPTLGLAGEVGEYCNKLKKVLRDGAEFSELDKLAELGDILWYLAQVAADADINLSDVAMYNLRKLADRQDRNKIGGSGDNR